MALILLGLIGGFQILMLLFIALLFVLVPIIALVDIIRSEFENSNDKLMWVIIVLFTSLIGVILYFIFAKKQKINDLNS